MMRALAVAAALSSATPAAADPPPRTPALVDKGRTSFNLYCAACHGVTGEGNGPVAFAVRPRPRNLRKDRLVQGDSVEQLFATITRGLPSGTMASYAQLPADERWALAYYVRTFR
jgi:mono/diheme cytochrome c family protein